MANTDDIPTNNVSKIMAELEEETMKGIWLKSPNLISGTSASHTIKPTPWEAVKKMSDTIHSGVEQAVRRMLDMGYRTDEIEINTINGTEGFTIQVRSKIKHRKASEFEIMLLRMWKEETAHKLLHHFAKSDDLSFRALKSVGLSNSEASELHAKFNSSGYLVVTCDLFHSCSPDPIGCYEVLEGEERAIMSHCPSCLQTIDPHHAWWGGYRYKLSAPAREIAKIAVENINMMEE